MKRFRRATAALLLLGLAVAAAGGTVAARADDTDGGKHISMLDDCDPNGGWEVVGGCTRKKGSVSFAEFNQEVGSPLSAAVIGHEAWRNDPPYSLVKAGTTLRVTNRGGREHTFTKVAQFGGGVVPPLTGGLAFSPECAGLVPVAPGETIRVPGLAVGSHRFLCCFHPWMRSVVKVTERGHGHDD